jgi:Family of unknown function (DUF716)
MRYSMVCPLPSLHRAPSRRRVLLTQLLEFTLKDKMILSRLLHDDEDDHMGAASQKEMGGTSSEAVSHEEMGGMTMSTGSSVGGGQEDVSLSGAFSGHFIPAAFFIGFGLFLLGLAMRRAVVNGKVAVPEESPRVLSGIGHTLSICTLLGFLVEAIGGYLAKNDLWFQSAHETLYALFFFAGVCAVLESRGRLPPDSSRVGVATALLGEYILWHEHALMKTNMVDQRIHIILANVSLSNCAVVAWSVYRGAESMLAYVLGYALLVLQGLWLLTAAFNIGVYQEHSQTGGFLTHHNVGVVFCLEILVVAFGIVAGTAFVYSRVEPDDQGKTLVAAAGLGNKAAKTQEYECLSHDLDFETGTSEFA